MEELIEKIKEYKIIVICAILGLVLGGFFLLKPVAQTPAKESNLQTEVTTVSKDSTDEKEDKKSEGRSGRARSKLLLMSKVLSNHPESMICQLEVVSMMLFKKLVA